MSYQPKINNLVSTANSSTVALSAGGVFTGTWEDATGYNSVIVAAKTDQNGTYSIQFSPDGSNADSALVRYYRTNQIEAPHRFTVSRKYCRVVFTNTSLSAQSYFRLQSSFGDKNDLNTPIDSTLAQDFDAISVRPTDFHMEAALGRRQGVTTWNRFGYNDDIDTGNAKIIAEWGGDMTILSAGEPLLITSTTLNDSGSGTGAQRIIIYGVDGNWNSQTEIITMSGTGTITTSTSWLGINRVAIYKAGTNLTNTGRITLSAANGGNMMSVVPASAGNDASLLFYVPAGHQFLTEWIYFNCIKVTGGGSGDPEVTFKGWVYSDVSTAKYEIFRAALDTINSNELSLVLPTPLVISEKSIVWFEASTTLSNTGVRGRFAGDLFRNVDATN